MISVDATGRIFKLDTCATTYSFAVTHGGHLNHLYYGRKVADAAALADLGNFTGYSFCPYPEGADYTQSRNSARCEFPSHMAGDYRFSAATIIDADGICTTDPLYVTHRIYNGKVHFTDMPASFADDVETLELTLRDAASGVEFILSYSVFAGSDVIARNVTVRNASSRPARLTKLMSASCDLEPGDYQFCHLSGEWARERHMKKQPLQHGTFRIDSNRTSSGHSHSPAFAVASQSCTEESGEVYAMLLVYSGSFTGNVEEDGFGNVRMSIGMNTEEFAWQLLPGAEFNAPEALLSFTAGGLGAMSRDMHKFIREHIVSPRWQAVERPILVNNWEATYFDFNAEKLLNLAKTASKSGIEMLVLDDGWFGKRDSDTSSLGDWFVNRDKIGDLDNLVTEIHALGMKFGLWFEPEMISEKSELYQKHPDWVLTAPGRIRTLGRHQMVLDMSRPEVIDYLFAMMSDLIASAGIDYIKWDMNRQPAEKYSRALGANRQLELGHRYVLGVYKLHRMLLDRFPDLLIEGCSGGGGRFDAGMLFYTPQIWTSDNTDAFERLAIQLGSSLFYPASAMGAHVSASPNHQTGRTSPFKTRGDVAMFGTFGYELDLTALPPSELEEIKKQTANFHRLNHIVRSGDLYRLTGADAGDDFCAWEFVLPDGSEAFAVGVLTRNFAGMPEIRLKLRGLVPDRLYRVSGDLGDFTMRGDALMYAGMTVRNLHCDGASRLLHLKQI